ncbi:MAG TPA: hypothetical protein VJT71_10715 [Pyrinomonadaceae bacterium]|nr:hypothetical protein [Pyrinomonadaceae bacterium]
MRTLYPSRRLHFISICLLLLAACLSVHAQSGRRSASKSTNTPPPVEPASTEVQSKPLKPARLQLVVGIDASAVFGAPYSLADTVLDECIRRLNEAPDVSVAAAGRRMTRSDAIKAAKDEKERFVVWLQLASESMVTSSQRGNEPSELYVNYLVLEPVTAKTKRVGRAAHTIYKAGTVGISRAPKNPIYSEYAIRQSAREAADQILDAFDIKLSESPSLITSR